MPSPKLEEMQLASFVELAHGVLTTTCFFKKSMDDANTSVTSVKVTEMVTFPELSTG